MKNLRKARRDKGLSCRALAEITNINFRSISQYERGVRRPSLGKIKILADALGVTPEYLDGLSDDPISVNLFGRRLRTARDCNCISQATLADMVGLTAPAISQYERGERLPDLDMQVVLAEKLGVDIQYLRGDDEYFLQKTLAAEQARVLKDLLAMPPVAFRLTVEYFSYLNRRKDRPDA
jgi:transcriptional regulator with XRE-family HTH domain